MLRRLVTCSSAIQLEIELQSSGFQLSDEAYRAGVEGESARLLDEFRRYRDGTPSHYITVTVHLTQSSTGWLYLKIGKPLEVEPVDADMRLYELRQGYYAAALSNTPALPGIVKLIHLSTGSTRMLSLGLHFSEFQIDPSQELMVLVAIEASMYAFAIPVDRISWYLPISSDMSTVHLRSFLKGNVHSATQYPDWKVQLPFQMYRRSSGIFVEVMDDLVAVKYVSFEKDVTEILIWNWKTSILLNRIQSLGTSCTFGFLTPNSVVLFQFATLEVPTVKLVIYDDIRTPRTLIADHPGYYHVSHYEPVTPRVEFGFPTLSWGSMAHLLLRAEPAPTMTSSGSGTFLPLPTARVLQLSMMVIQNHEEERGLSQYQIFIGKERLLKRLSLLNNQPQPLEHPVLVPWDDWGEYTTRWFKARSAMSPWICRTYGTRFIQSNPFGDDPNDLPLEYISILDFHTPTIRRFARAGDNEHLSMWKSKDERRHIDMGSTDEELEYVLNTIRSKHDSSIEDDDRVFVDTIDEDVPSVTPFNGEVLHTRLPYRVVTRVQPVPKHSGWMIDNNLIIGMPVCLLDSSLY
jgi:hypothetical protein